MKRRQVLLVVIVVLLLGTVALSQLAAGNFNAATGFSGRHGFTCTSCHNVPDMGPLGEDEVYGEPAEVTVFGLPEEWEHGLQYNLRVLVEGGPPEIHTGPVPSGGFEVEVDRGVFSLIDDDFNSRIYAEDGRGITYTQAGAMVREWSFIWTAPGVEERPGTATFWVAGMSANGNHVVAAGQSDGGELGDSVDNITVAVPPSQATLDAWEAYRLDPPLIDGEMQIERIVAAFTAFTIQGEHLDPAATHIGYSLDGAGWERKATPGAAWRLDFGNGLTPGEHTLLLRSEADDGRVSEMSTVQIMAEEADVDAVEISFPSVLAVGALLMAAGWRRRR